MPEYTIYKQETGQIVRLFTCSDPSDLELNIKSGQGYIDGTYLPDLYMVENGQPVALPEKPDYPCWFDYSTKQWVWNEQASWANLRAKRDKLLAACDWTQVPDAPVDHAAWAAYRQALRDLPANIEDPRNPQWPTPPA